MPTLLLIIIVNLLIVSRLPKILTLKVAAKLNSKSFYNYPQQQFISNNKLFSINETQLNLISNKHVFSSSYAPYDVLCPSTSLIRAANNVCPLPNLPYIVFNG